MKKIKTFLFYFFLSVVIFVLIFIFANSPLGVKRIPAPSIPLPFEERLEMPVGKWSHKTNPVFYFTDVITTTGKPCFENPFILLYWYFLSLLITFLLYKRRVYKFLIKILILIIVGIIGYSIYWYLTVPLILEKLF